MHIEYIFISKTQNQRRLDEQLHLSYSNKTYKQSITKRFNAYRIKFFKNIHMIIALICQKRKQIRKGSSPNSIIFHFDLIKENGIEMKGKSRPNG